KARAIVDVDNVHLLVLEDVGGLQQIGVDRDRPHVVQVAIGDGRAVDLRLEHHALHVVIAFPEWVTEEGTAEGSRIKLSIRRVPPTWAATASRADACRRVTGSIVSGSTG